MFDWRNGVRAALALATLATAACSEKLVEGGACGTLCPSPQIVVVDTVLTPVDSTVTVPGYPGSGLEGRLLLAYRPTDLDVRAVVRFDTLPMRFVPKAGDTTTAAITHADSTRLHLRLDLTSSVTRAPVTIDLFDVDAGSRGDTSVRSALPYFVPARLIGTRTLARVELLDTISLPISDSVLVAKASAGKALRIGLRATSDGQTELRFISTESGAAVGTAPYLSFRPSADTAVKAITVVALDRDSLSARSAAINRADYSIVVRGETPVSTANGSVEVGGLPGRRAYLRFVIPPQFSDTTLTVVRAELQLTQLRGATSSDTVVVFPLVSLAGRAVNDPRRAAGLVDGGLVAGGSFPLDSLVIATGDSATRSVSVLRVVRFWASASEKNNPHALVLRTRYESTNPGTVRFASGSATVPVEQRPRLVISYVKRVPFNLP